MRSQPDAAQQRPTKVFLKLCVETRVVSIPKAVQASTSTRKAWERFMPASWLRPVANRNRSVSPGPIAVRWSSTAPRTASERGTLRPLTARTYFPPPPFEVLACYGDFTDDIGTVPDLADSQRKQLLDPVPRSAAQDQEQPVTRAVGGGEVLGESEVFGFGEGAGTHAHKMALP